LVEPFLIQPGGGLFLPGDFLGGLGHDSGGNLRQLFGNAGGRAAGAHIVGQFPKPLHQIHIGCHQSILALGIFMKGLGHAVLEGSHPPAIQGGIHVDADDGVSPGHDRGGAFHLGKTCGNADHPFGDGLIPIGAAAFGSGLVHPNLLGCIRGRSRLIGRRFVGRLASQKPHGSEENQGQGTHHDLSSFPNS